MSAAVALTNKNTALFSFGNQKTAIAPTYQEAVDLIRKDVGSMVRERLADAGEFNPDDWRVNVLTEEVKNGLFWHNPSRGDSIAGHTLI